MAVFGAMYPSQDELDSVSEYGDEEHDELGADEGVVGAGSTRAKLQTPDELERELEEHRRLEEELRAVERDLASKIDDDPQDISHGHEALHASTESIQAALLEQERLSAELRAVEAELARSELSPQRSEGEEERLQDALAERARLEQELAVLQDELDARGQPDSTGLNNAWGIDNTPGSRAAADDALHATLGNRLSRTTAPTAASTIPWQLPHITTHDPRESPDMVEVDGGQAALVAAVEESRRLEAELDALAAELSSEGDNAEAGYDDNDASADVDQASDPAAHDDHDHEDHGQDDHDQDHEENYDDHDDHDQDQDENYDDHEDHDANDDDCNEGDVEQPARRLASEPLVPTTRSCSLALASTAPRSPVLGTTAPLSRLGGVGYPGQIGTGAPTDSPDPLSTTGKMRDLQAQAEVQVQQVQHLTETCDALRRALAHSEAAREAAEMAMSEAEEARDEAEAGWRESEEQVARLAELAKEADKQLQASIAETDELCRTHEAAVHERDRTIAMLRQALAAKSTASSEPAPATIVTATPAASVGAKGQSDARSTAVPSEIVAALKGHRPGSALRQSWSPATVDAAAATAAATTSGLTDATGGRNTAPASPMTTAGALQGKDLGARSTAGASGEPMTAGDGGAGGVLDYSTLLKTVVALQDENQWLTQCLSRARELHRTSDPNYDGRAPLLQHEAGRGRWTHQRAQDRRDAEEMQAVAVALEGLGLPPEANGWLQLRTLYRELTAVRASVDTAQQELPDPDLQSTSRSIAFDTMDTPARTPAAAAAAASLSHTVDGDGGDDTRTQLATALRRASALTGQTAEAQQALQVARERVGMLNQQNDELKRGLADLQRTRDAAQGEGQALADSLSRKLRLAEAEAEMVRDAVARMREEHASQLHALQADHAGATQDLFAELTETRRTHAAEVDALLQQVTAAQLAQAAAGPAVERRMREEMGEGTRRHDQTMVALQDANRELKGQCLDAKQLSDSLQRQLAAATANTERAERTLAEESAALAALRTRMPGLNQKIAELQAQGDLAAALRPQLVSAQAEHARLTSELAAAQADAAVQARTLAAARAAAEAAGEESRRVRQQLQEAEEELADVAADLQATTSDAVERDAEHAQRDAAHRRECEQLAIQMERLDSELALTRAAAEQSSRAQKQDQLGLQRERASLTEELQKARAEIARRDQAVADLKAQLAAARDGHTRNLSSAADQHREGSEALRRQHASDLDHLRAQVVAARAEAEAARREAAGAWDERETLAGMHALHDQDKELLRRELVALREAHGRDQLAATAVCQAANEEVLALRGQLARERRAAETALADAHRQADVMRVRLDREAGALQTSERATKAAREEHRRAAADAERQRVAAEQAVRDLAVTRAAAAAAEADLTRLRAEVAALRPTLASRARGGAGGYSSGIRAGEDSAERADALERQLQMQSATITSLAASRDSGGGGGGGGGVAGTVGAS